MQSPNLLSHPPLLIGSCARPHTLQAVASFVSPEGLTATLLHRRDIRQLSITLDGNTLQVREGGRAWLRGRQRGGRGLCCKHAKRLDVSQAQWHHHLWCPEICLFSCSCSSLTLSCVSSTSLYLHHVCRMLLTVGGGVLRSCPHS